MNATIKSQRITPNMNATTVFKLAATCIITLVSLQDDGCASAFQSSARRNHRILPPTKLFSGQTDSDSPFVAEKTDIVDETNKDGESASIDFGQSVPYVPLNQRQSTLVSNQSSPDVSQILQRNRTRNIIIAVTSFAVSIMHYIWQLTHPVTAVEILATMQSQSAPLTSIGNNGKPTVIDFWYVLTTFNANIIDSMHHVNQFTSL
jgi:hypothetical protein